MKTFFHFTFFTFLLTFSFTGKAQDSTEEEEKAPVPLEEDAVFPGGMREFYKYIGRNVRYPQEAKQLNIEGKVIVLFTVTKTGEIADAKVIRGIGSGCDEEALRVIKASPNWIPGKQRGVPVNSRMAVPITFKLGGGYSRVLKDRVARPSIGMEAFYAYAKKETKYPKKAKKNKIEGTVILSVNISPLGSIEDITIIKGLGYGLDEEAIRLVKEGPEWLGEIKNNQRVSSVVELKIEFKR